MGLLPFEHYPGNADAAAQAAQQLRAERELFAMLESELAVGRDSAAEQVVGELCSAVATVAGPPRTGADQLGTAALVASGAIDHFARAIRTYDRHIDELNERYAKARADSFGVAGKAGDSPDGSEDHGSSGGVLGTADLTLQYSLECERLGYQAALDESADYAAAVLKSDSTDSALLALCQTGDLRVTDVADALGMTLSALNDVRRAVGTTSTVIGWKQTLPALTKYLKEPSKLNGDHLVNVTKPGSLWGEKTVLRLHRAGEYTRTFARYVEFGKFAGRWLPPAAVIAGGYGLYDAIRNGDGGFDDWNDGIGNAASIISGGSVTALALGLTAGAPIVAAIAVAAGVIAIGSLGVHYREEIADAAKWAGARIADGWNATTDWTGDRLEDAGDVVHDIGDDVGKAAVELGDAAENVSETVGDVTDNLTPGVDLW